MTKRHFIALADALRASQPEGYCEAQVIEQWEQDRDAIAQVCASANPRFNRQRWLDYIDGKCGPGGGAVK